MEKRLFWSFPLFIAALAAAGLWEQFGSGKKAARIIKICLAVCLALLALGWGIAANMKITAWDLPTRLVAAAWLLPISAALEKKIGKWAPITYWGLLAVFGVLMALNKLL